MNTHRYRIVAGFFVVALVLYGGNAQAQLLEEKITVTFSNPVEVPGHVLPAGSYVFESLRGGTVTRILSADESQIYATLLTVPDERPEPMNKAKVILRDSPEKTNERIDEWFYPGMSVGHEFSYPKDHSGKAMGVAHSGRFVAGHTAGTIGHGLKALV